MMRGGRQLDRSRAKEKISAIIAQNNISRREDDEVLETNRSLLGAQKGSPKEKPGVLKNKPIKKRGGRKGKPWTIVKESIKAIIELGA
jgi:hypothetical protein